MNKLKYTHYDIVFQEVPNETTLVFNISGCPHRCEGCHSKYLWKYTGKLLSEDIEMILNNYKEMITCVCFMGGDQNLTELNNLLRFVKEKYKIKTCVYSGLDDCYLFNDMLDILDFLKIGRYIQALGGLESKGTNQKFYKIKNSIKIDITSKFQ